MRTVHITIRMERLPMAKLTPSRRFSQTEPAGRSVRGPEGTGSSNMALRKITLLMTKKRGPAPNAASIKPAARGPMIEAIWEDINCPAIAFMNTLGPTRLYMRVFRAVSCRPIIVLWTMEMIKMCHTSITPAMKRSPRIRMAAAMMIWASIRIVRRLNLSTSTPPSGLNNMLATPPSPGARPTMKGEPVISKMTQP